MLVLLASLLPSANAATLGPGEPVERALAIHLSSTGLTHLGDAVEGLVPAQLPISGVSGQFECDEADPSPLQYALTDTAIDLAAENVDLYTQDGALHLDLYLSISSSPAELAVSGDCTFLADLDEVCGMEIPTSLAIATFTLDMGLEEGDDGLNVIRVTASDPSVEISPIGNPLSDCTLSSAIGTLLGQNDEAISDLLLSFIEPELGGVGADLALSVEEALTALTLETDFGIGDASMDLVLEPTLLELAEEGLVLGLGATATPSALSDCVPSSAGSEFNDADWPAFDDTAWDTSLEYDAAIYMNKEFLDAVVWNLWAAGGLCLDVASLSDGLALGSDLFGSFFGEDFAALYPEDTPIDLRTAPETPPEIVFSDDGAPIVLALEEFGLDFIGPLDDRRDRLFQVGLTADIGIDPGIGSDGIAPLIVMDTDRFEFTEPFNELIPGGFSVGLADFLPTVLESFLPELPTLPLPSLQGIGIDTVFWIPDDTATWQGGFVMMDLSQVEPLIVPGCEGGSIGCDGESSGLDLDTILGCSDGGCDTGCDQGCEDSSCSTHSRRRLVGIFTSRAMVLSFIFGLVVMRRRRD